jgi:hypothetical protein
MIAITTSNSISVKLLTCEIPDLRDSFFRRKIPRCNDTHWLCKSSHGNLVKSIDLQALRDRSNTLTFKAGKPSPAIAAQSALETPIQD